MQSNQNLKAWVLAAGVALTFCLNQTLAVTNYHWVTYLSSIALIALSLVVSLVGNLKKYSPIILFLILFGFPAYGADPYLSNYISPFGYSKFAASICLLSILNFRFTLAGVAFLILLIFSTLVGMYFQRIGGIKFEIWYALIILAILNSYPQKNKNGHFDLFCDACERFFYLTPFMAFYISFMNLSDFRAGNTEAFFYGHWLGIIAAYALFSVVSGRSSVFKGSIQKWSALAICLYVCRTSFQSFHFLLLLITTLISFLNAFFKKEKKQGGVWSAVIVLVILFALASNFLEKSERSNWLYLKISQITVIFSGATEDSNSVQIRIAEFLSILNQGTIGSNLFGSGVGATYLPQGPYWKAVIFHAATFPESEINSGVLQYVHEPIVMIFKWAGVFGLIFAISGIRKRIKLIHSKEAIAILFAVSFLLLFAASVHTGILVSVLILLIPAEYKFEPNTMSERKKIE